MNIQAKFLNGDDEVLLECIVAQAPKIGEHVRIAGTLYFIESVEWEYDGPYTKVIVRVEVN